MPRRELPPPGCPRRWPGTDAWRPADIGLDPDRRHLPFRSLGAAVRRWLRRDGRAFPAHDEGNGPWLADCAALPPPVRRSAADREEEFVVAVDRSARAMWAVWIAGTREPVWDELPERVRERVRASARAGLAASGLLPPPGTTGPAGSGEGEG